MPKRIQIAAHLSVKELEHRYRQAKDGVERSPIKSSGCWYKAGTLRKCPS